MDWPVTTQARYHPDEGDGATAEPRVFFTKEELPFDRLGIVKPSRTEPTEVRPIGHRHLRPAWLLLAGGAVGLIACGAAIWVDLSRGPVAHPVPPAANSAAATTLPPPNLLRPLSPEEATEENADRPFVNRSDTAASRFVLRTDAVDRERALTCLAQAVYYEAAGEGVDGQRAVAQVVLNRLHHPGFPSTVCGVVYQGGDRPTGCQFSFVCDGSMQRLPVPSLWTRSRQIAEQALAGKVFAPVGHATHYHANYVLPYWADSLDKSTQVGRHIFYRLRSIFGEGRAFSQRYGGTEPQVRVPGAALVIAPVAVTPQLANALISDSPDGPAKDTEKAATKPTTPLAADSMRGTLLADSAAPHLSPPRKPKSSGECSTSSADRKQLAPLGANEIRGSTDGSVC